MHPYTLKPTFVPKSKTEKKDQHRFFFWYKKENRQWVKDKLLNAGKPELLEKLVGDQKAKKTERDVPKWLAEKRKGRSKRNRRK